ncbi:MAG TPA: trypsin-like peptidase domain-containing protein [Planctomycetota bacterium]|nr:trypsin-like peptidase domain-containing protein [Planctomycetota bacterium]
MRGLRGPLLLACLTATAPGGELAVAEGAVKRAAALARPAVVTVITADQKDVDLTGVVIAPSVVLTARSPLARDGKLPPSISIRLPGRGSTLEASLLDDDEKTDTALYKADSAAGVKALSPARAEDIHEGMWVLLVGNAFGQGRESTPTLSLGVVSAVSRERDQVLAFHASAPVNPGAIGAPVVDLTGDLVGIAANAVTDDGEQTVVVPYDAIRAAYLGKEGKGSKVVGRPPPPRPIASRIDDDLGKVLEDAAKRAARVLVAVRAMPLEGELEVIAGLPAQPKEGAHGQPPAESPPPARRVPGALRAYDRSSGLVVGEDGLILCPLRITGWPQASRPLVVDLVDGQSFPATVLGTDERLRVALLKIGLTGMKPLEPVPSEELRAGQLAIALGYPHLRPGQETPQLTFGIVSRTGALTDLHPAFDAIATDAAVSESNRGGPLVDVDGRLLGMILDVNDTNVQGYLTGARGAYAGNAGLGFAVPWSVIARILPRLKEGRALRNAFLGIATSETPQGLEVVDVTEKNSAGQPTGAMEAGITKGDLILAIDGKQVPATRDLKRAIASLSAGDKMTLHIRRGDKEMDVTVTLTDR